MAKITKKNNLDVCPKCKSDSMVMGMKTGTIHVFGCIECRNAQGMHRTMRDAKAAWKRYVENFQEIVPR